MATSITRRAGSLASVRPSSASTAAANASASASIELEPVVGDAPLELRRRALGDDAAAVEHGDAVGQPVGLLEVLGGEEHGHALAGEPGHRVPHRLAAARVEADGRLVEEHDRRAADQPGGEVEPAAHAAGVGADAPAAGVAELEAVAAARRRGRGRRSARALQAAHHAQVLLPGLQLVDRGVLAGEADRAADAAAVGDDVEPGDARRARIGRSSVHRSRTVVVLPAPFGPSSEKTVPGRTLQVDAGQHGRLAVGLAEPRGLYCVWHTHNCVGYTQFDAARKRARRPPLPASLDAAWGRRARPTKGPKPGLSLERIVAAAVALAHAEGLGAVSMARVASELGSSPMSLYRYVDAKDELLALMVDAALGDPPPPPAGEGWRDGLARWAWGYHDALRRHPWALHVPISAARR